MRKIWTIALLAVAIAGLSACQSAPKTQAEPVASGLLVRNMSAFDINVYALVGVEKREWLSTVPAKGQRSIPIEKRMLHGESNLVLQTQAVGSTAVWTSNPLQVSADVVGILDLSVANNGDCSSSLFYSVKLEELQAAWR